MECCNKSGNSFKNVFNFEKAVKDCELNNLEINTFFMVTVNQKVKSNQRAFGNEINSFNFMPEWGDYK